MALALTFLAACSTNERGTPVSEELRFGAESPDALVIVGLRSTTKVTDGGFIYERPLLWKITWSRFDPGSLSFVVPLEDMTARRDNCPLLEHDTPFECSGDHRELQYTAKLVKPGMYALRQAAHLNRTTVYATNERSLIVDHSLRLLLAKKKIPWFEAKAGEIVYIGDYVFDAAEAPIELETFERSDEALEQARSEIPGVKGEILYRGPDIPKPRSAALDERTGA